MTVPRKRDEEREKKQRESEKKSKKNTQQNNAPYHRMCPHAPILLPQQQKKNRTLIFRFHPKESKTSKQTNTLADPTDRGKYNILPTQASSRNGAIHTWDWSRTSFLRENSLATGHSELVSCIYHQHWPRHECIEKSQNNININKKMFIARYHTRRTLLHWETRKYLSMKWEFPKIQTRTPNRTIARNRNKWSMLRSCTFAWYSFCSLLLFFFRSFHYSLPPLLQSLREKAVPTSAKTYWWNTRSRENHQNNDIETEGNALAQCYLQQKQRETDRVRRGRCFFYSTKGGV